MEAWIPITIAAAFLQNVRSMLQKQAMRTLSSNGAAYTRFCYALPFVWLYLGLLLIDRSLPDPNWVFVGWCLLGGVAQIASTSFLVASFAHGSFAVGTAFSKTEVAQTAVVGLVLIGDALTVPLVAGILISFVGVVMLSARARLRTLFAGNRALGFGLLAGTGLAIASVSYRAAALSLDDGDYLIRAGATLALTVTLQIVLMGLYLRAREPGEITRVAGSWRTSIWVGIAGAAASVAWFTAMTLVSAGLVRALGQVELLFTFAATVWFFKEPVRIRDLAGAGLIVCGILLLLI